MKPINVRSLLMAHEVFAAALDAAKKGKAQTFVFEAVDGLSRVEYEVRLTKVDGKRIGLATMKKAFEESEGAPRP